MKHRKSSAFYVNGLFACVGIIVFAFFMLFCSGCRPEADPDPGGGSQVKRLIPDSVVNAGLIAQITQAEASTYKAYYDAWVSKVDTCPAMKAIEGYNISFEMVKAIEEQYDKAGTAVQKVERGVRTLFGLKKAYDPANPDDVYQNMVMMVYPLKADGESVAVAAGTNVFITDIKDYYVRPCPKYCN